ncbi:hypothetical protein [Streptomyces sp. NPDC088801]|uniref:hypothetical protein n=1 Tax=Streptomyces sp. NPDC088801 TaxID=3365903 RepID=UPI00381A502D
MDKRSPTAERHADLVRTALLHTAPSGMTLLELAAVCGLSHWQTRQGISVLKDVCAQNEWPPQESLLRPVVASRSSAEAVIVVQAQHASSAHHHEHF